MYRIAEDAEVCQNYYLGARLRGASVRLCGNVALISCLMRHHRDSFDPATLTQYYAALNQAISFLQKEAARYGAPLSIKGYKFDVDTPPNADPRDGYALIADFLGKASMEEAQATYEKKYGVEEAPFLLVFDAKRRSFSWKQDRRPTNEISVIFQEQNGFSWKCIAHELLHQFGAQDFYYPQQVKACAEAYLGESIMGARLAERVDDLTAYLVGWKSTVDEKTYRFLKDTMWMTDALHRQYAKAEWQG